jgi:hypothetical protein
MSDLSLDLLGRNHGLSPIGAAQRTIPFSAVANYNSGQALQITANNHALKKGQCVRVDSGAYVGTRRVWKVIDANNIVVDGTFGSTSSGNLKLDAHLEGFGFFVDSDSTTLTAIVLKDDSMDPASIIAMPLLKGVEYAIEFDRIQVSTGNITVVRRPVPFKNYI